MPPNGAQSRAQQITTINSISHEKLVRPEMGELIDSVKESDEYTGDVIPWIRELEFVRDRACKLPSRLVSELSMETAKAFSVWTEAKRKKDFSIFSPALNNIIQLTREAAECYGYEEKPWDALVPPYERGLTAASIHELFKPLKESTVTLLDKIMGSQKVDTSFLEQKWSIDTQKEFGLRVARDIGYDLNAGRQDVTAHPFCTTLGYGDVRITTRYDEYMGLESLLATVHEAGHAMYEQGFKKEDARSPFFDAPSLGIHESQSRFWEVRIARSRSFWKHYLPIMKQYYPGQLDGVTVNDFYKAMNEVKPGFTRVEADEVCYNLHVIIRFELELAIFDGDLKTEDLPSAWNELYKKYLNLDVPDDSKGCLQDVHWAYGSFGYFPTYSVGNIYNAMLTKKMESDRPGMWNEVESGQFAPTLAWLRENIHQYGRRHLARDLVEKVTGEKVSCEPLIDYMNQKYSEIYNL